MINKFELDMLLENANKARIQGDKRFAADRYRQAGDLLIEAGDYDNAIRILYSSVSLEMELGNPAQAETTLRRALTLVSREDVAYLEPQVIYHLAQALLAQGRKQDAILHLTRIIPLEKQFETDLYTPEARKELEKLGVEINLGKRPTAATVEEIQPDAVIVATGAVPLVPPIAGVKQ